MTRYRMNDGTVIDTGCASQSWEEETRWNGNNHIGLASVSQFSHQTLYRSRKGRYYIEHTSDWQGTIPHVEWVSPQEAARWLLLMDEDLPEDLEQYEDDLVE